MYKFVKQNPEWLNGASVENYHELIKTNYVQLKHSYYSILKYKHINTISGKMLALRLSEDIYDPNKDIIVRAQINRYPVYYYQDKYWLTAQLSHGKQIILMRERIDSNHFAIIYQI